MKHRLTDSHCGVFVGPTPTPSASDVPLVRVQTAVIEELEAAADERQHGPKHHVQCPDCNATLAIFQLENGRYEIRHVKHAS